MSPSIIEIIKRGALNILDSHMKTVAFQGSGVIDVDF